MNVDDYPIGSQWVDAEGDRVTVTGHATDHVYVDWVDCDGNPQRYSVYFNQLDTWLSPIPEPAPPVAADTISVTVQPRLIKVELNGNRFELTEDDAKRLRDELDKAIGDKVAPLDIGEVFLRRLNESKPQPDLGWWQTQPTCVQPTIDVRPPLNTTVACDSKENPS